MIKILLSREKIVKMSVFILLSSIIFYISYYLFFLLTSFAVLEREKEVVFALQNTKEDDKKDVLGVFTKITGKQKVIAPIPSANLSPLPTFTPTPTPTNTPTPTPTSTPTPTYTPTPTPTKQIPPSASSLDEFFSKYSKEYGIEESALRKIAVCESGYNTSASNGPYGGMFQYSDSTWTSTRSQMGLDGNPELRFNAEESIKTTAFKISRGGIGAWPNCSQ